MTQEAAKIQNPPQAAPPAEEKQTNCLGCGKPLKRIKRYYRNGKFYCTKKCWLKAKQAKTKEGEAK